MQLIFKKSLQSVQTGGYFIRNESISDGAAIVVKGPCVAGVAVGKDLKGGGIRTGKHPAEIIHVVGVAGISVVENPKCRNADILHHDAVEDNVGGSNDIREIGIWNRGNVRTGIAWRHRTHVRWRWSWTGMMMDSTGTKTWRTVAIIAGTIVMIRFAAMSRTMIVGLAAIARAMIVGLAAIAWTMVVVARTIIFVWLMAIARTGIMLMLGFVVTFPIASMVVSIYVSKS